MSADYMSAKLSGPNEHLGEVLEHLNTIAGYVAFSTTADNPNDLDPAWIQVIAYRIHGVDLEVGDFQRQVAESLRVAFIADRSFHVRSSGYPIDSAVRQYSNYNLTGPIVSPDAVLLTERATADLLWDQLRRVAHAPQALAQIRNLSCSYSSDNVNDEFSSYIMQAETYFRAGSVTEGASSSLFFYYAFLNLAKAELILWKPDLILNPASKHMHGLSAIHTSPTIRDWGIKVQKTGIFPELYEKRLGVRWEQDWPRVQAIDIFARCPEAGLEFSQAGYGSGQVTGFYHSIVTDRTASWSQMLVEDYTLIAENPPVKDLILQYYDEQETPPRGRDLYGIFSISRRHGFTRAKLLSARYPKGVRRPGNMMDPSLARDEWFLELREHLRPIVGGSKNGCDGMLSMSLSDTSMIPFPDDIARYAAIYLLSSLVRYKPSALNARLHAEQAWYLAAFARQSALLGLHSFVNQILDGEFLCMDITRP